MGTGAAKLGRFPPRRLLCLQACSGPSGSPSRLAPRDLGGGAGRWKANATVWTRVPPPRRPSLHAFPPPFSLPSPPLSFSPLPSRHAAALEKQVLAQREGGPERLALALEDSCSPSSSFFPGPGFRREGRSFNLQLYFEGWATGSPEGRHLPDLVPKPNLKTDAGGRKRGRREDRSTSSFLMAARGSFQGRRGYAEGRISYKLRGKKWPSQPTLCETFAIPL